uniref:Uncharacterized protein n=1 Tax=viral metagenome TaxID=1070528 RepID=A0A6M3LGA4_9ZZZZ
MSLEEDLEFTKIATLARQFQWEVVRQEVQDQNLVVVLKKPRALGPEQLTLAAGPVSSMPT